MHNTESNVQFLCRYSFVPLNVKDSCYTLQSQCSGYCTYVHIHSIPILLQALFSTHVCPSLVCWALLSSNTRNVASTTTKMIRSMYCSLHSLQVWQYTHFLKFLTKVCVFLDSSSQFKCVLTGLLSSFLDRQFYS